MMGRKKVLILEFIASTGKKVNLIINKTTGEEQLAQKVKELIENGIINDQEGTDIGNLFRM